MTGEQLYNGWWLAASKVHVQLIRWDALPQATVDAWIRVARLIDEGGYKPPPSPDHFINLFGCGPGTPTALAIAGELLTNWFYYFPTFEGSNTVSSHAKGDIWLFKAGKSKGVVIDVDGSKVKLRLNGIETDWVEEAELAKDATKQAQ